MALKNINPTKTIAWEKLTSHFEKNKDFSLRNAFYKDENRTEKFTINTDDISLDYSKNLVSEKTMKLLFELANEVDLKDAIEKYFTGDIINQTEKRAVLHTALRSTSDEEIIVDGKDIKPKIQTTLRKIRAFSNKVISGKWRGYTGEKITDVVNIGIGGSDLGASMVVEGLQFYRNHLNLHFVSNIDGDHVSEILRKINPETTLFIIVSKTFTTLETITNAETIKNWFLKKASIFDVAKHFVAVSTNVKAVEHFGIDKKNMFPMWDWVGGRFSIWSAVGLSVSLAIGFNNFRAFLDGAEQMDKHFRTTKFDKNIPVVLALLSVWYNNFHNTETEAVLTYSQYLSKFPKHLQQMIMESNGKSVDRNGKPLNYQTGTIIWGDTGVNMQHAFMQLIHQGTKLIPTDFIGFKNSLHNLEYHHKALMANFYAQTEALAFGKTKEEVHLEMKTSGNIEKINELLPFKIFEGNRPSNVILADKLTPKTLGMLIAMYEHKTFVQGVIWNIYSYDQFGVELGKELANKILNK